MAVTDLTGRKFGKLTVTGYAGRSNSGRYMWQVVCSCGRSKTVEAGNLKRGATTSCGCTAANKPLELAGLVFGRLTVISLAEGRSKKRDRLWKAACTCGTVVTVPGYRLLDGHITSCGCGSSRRSVGLRSLVHGKSKKPEFRRTYSIWVGMRQRCTNKNRKGYVDYGGRGVSCCERWNSFEAFLEDMGVCPEGLTIERVNNNGNYEPTNCIWADMVTQNRNKRPRKDRARSGKGTHADRSRVS